MPAAPARFAAYSNELNEFKSKGSILDLAIHAGISLSGKPEFGVFTFEFVAQSLDHELMIGALWQSRDCNRSNYAGAHNCNRK